MPTISLFRGEVANRRLQAFFTPETLICFRQVLQGTTFSPPLSSPPTLLFFQAASESKFGAEVQKGQLGEYPKINW